MDDAPTICHTYSVKPATSDLNSFERAFMEHTLTTVQEYTGEYKATMLINRLVGLLIVPGEKFSDESQRTLLTN